MTSLGDANTKAPQEIKEVVSDLKAQHELTKTERKSLRRTKKRKQQKDFKEKEGQRNKANDDNKDSKKKKWNEKRDPKVNSIVKSRKSKEALQLGKTLSKLQVTK